MLDESLARHRTARHLDDPTPLVAGLGFLQVVGIVLGLLVAYWAWGALSFLGTSTNGLDGDVHFTLVVLAFALVAGPIYLQFGKKVEPFALQLLRYLVRTHRYRPDR